MTNAKEQALTGTTAIQELPIMKVGDVISVDKQSFIVTSILQCLISTDHSDHKEPLLKYYIALIPLDIPKDHNSN
jgi:hypothetical protein